MEYANGRGGDRGGQLEDEEAHAAVNLVDEPGPGAKQSKENRTKDTYCGRHRIVKTAEQRCSPARYSDTHRQQHHHESCRDTSATACSCSPVGAWAARPMAEEANDHDEEAHERCRARRKELANGAGV